MLKQLSDEAIVSARFQCVCSVGYPVSDGKATELARYVAQAQLEDTLRQVVEEAIKRKASYPNGDVDNILMSNYFRELAKQAGIK
ncbi:hypothetical protein LCGC14_1729080 [marine sediment metagenome]|uniref:Uncharacterized protein n=1 Tax=marine sediment metagenome TaxID=412755 RepID=A0A0F9HA49_9ZZZZ